MQEPMADHAGAPDPRDAPQNSTATRKKFTDRFIRDLKPRSKRHDLPETAGARDGFGIRVAPSERKTFSTSTTSAGGNGASVWVSTPA